MFYMLDTDISSYIIKGCFRDLKAKLSVIEPLRCAYQSLPAPNCFIN